MDKATKQYRQYIFKVNHKLSRKAAKMGDASLTDNPKVRGMLRAASKVDFKQNSLNQHFLRCQSRRCKCMQCLLSYSWDWHCIEVGGSRLPRFPSRKSFQETSFSTCVQSRDLFCMSIFLMAETLFCPMQIQKRKHPEADGDDVVRRTSHGWRQHAPAVGSHLGRGTQGPVDIQTHTSSSSQSAEDSAERPLKSPSKSKGGSNPGKPSQPTRPTPRHFRDLPASLAFEPLGKEKAGPSNIVGRMATSAAVQNR